MRRVLVAGTQDVVDAARAALGADLELPAAYSVAEALKHIEGGVDLVLCNVRFDDSRMFDFIPKQVRGGLTMLPPVKRITDQVLADFGIPRSVLVYINYPTDFDSTKTQVALEETGIAVPELRSYADKLWDYWERNLDPDLFKDRSFEGAINGRTVCAWPATLVIPIMLSTCRMPR